MTSTTSLYSGLSSHCCAVEEERDEQVVTSIVFFFIKMLSVEECYGEAIFSQIKC